MRISEAITLLREAGIDSARHDARQIFIYFAGFRIEELLAEDVDSQSDELLSAIRRRCQREPLQYILGEVSFYKENYTVTPDCLIPRADTEILVDYAIKNIPQGEQFIDLCTGSGCIAISTLKNTNNTRAIAVDVSDGALAIAKTNAKKNGVCDRLELILADVKEKAIGDKVFAVLSNPPYVTDTEYESLEPEIYYEPKLAFVGGEDGLDFYRRTLELYKNRIKTEGFFAFEIGCEQGPLISRIASEHKMSSQILQDLGGRDRVAILKHL